MNSEALLEKERTKHLAVNFRTDRVYNAGLIASIENDERKAECYFCGYIDNQIHLDVHENGTIRSILSVGSIGKPTIIEMADCAIELVIINIGTDYIKTNIRIAKIDLCKCNNRLELNGGGLL
jgi:hypothetical protein